MESSTLLARYDEQLRADAEVDDADEVVRIGPVLAATFPARRRGFVTHPPFRMAGPELERLVESVVAHYAADPRVDDVEWKTRGHDPLPELLGLLQDHGFTVEEPETVMAGSVAAAIDADPGLPTGHTLERATTPAAVREAESLAGRVFGDSEERSRQRADELVHRLQNAPDSFQMWAVRDPRGRVVSSGRVDFIAGTEFASLWGGACEQEHRGRGLYRALVAERARQATTRGKRWLQVDCTEFSRPILQRAGLLPITSTTPATWRRA